MTAVFLYAHDLKIRELLVQISLTANRKPLMIRFGVIIMIAVLIMYDQSGIQHYIKGYHRSRKVRHVDKLHIRIIQFDLSRVLHLVKAQVKF